MRRGNGTKVRRVALPVSGPFAIEVEVCFWLTGCRPRIIETRKQVYDKFLEFIDKSQHYQVDRLFGHLPAEGLLHYPH